MQTTIVTGLSGAGKTQAIDYLEDFGFFCIDNLPLQLLPKLTELSAEAGHPKIAVVVDVRSLSFEPGSETFAELEALKKAQDSVDILYLEADEPALVRRYQQSRRRHPLTERAGSLENAIQEETALLAPLRAIADTVIDTSALKPAELYERLRRRFAGAGGPDEMQLNILSFGFKYGTPRSADFVFDARFLPNPFYIDALKNKTGEDQEVRDYVMSEKTAQDYLKRIAELLADIIPAYIKIDKTCLTVAFGCTGGQHRSVTFAVLLAEAMQQLGYPVTLEHRDILKDRTKQ